MYNKSKETNLKKYDRRKVNPKVKTHRKKPILKKSVEHKKITNLFKFIFSQNLYDNSSPVNKIKEENKKKILNLLKIITLRKKEILKILIPLMEML